MIGGGGSLVLQTLAAARWIFSRKVERLDIFVCMYGYVDEIIALG